MAENIGNLASGRGENGEYRGRLRGKTKTKSAWSNYNILVQDGMIKLYKGKVLKGDYDLAGSVFEKSADSPLSLTLSVANQQKTIITLEAEEEREITKLINALNSGIYQKNVSALINGFRTPQVIEWYFQKQGEFREYEPLLKIKYKFLMKQCPPSVICSLPVVVYLSINSSLNGLNIEIERDQLPSIYSSLAANNHLELLHTILFRDITSTTKQTSLISSSGPGNNVLPTEIVVVLSPVEENIPRSSGASSLPHELFGSNQLQQSLSQSQPQSFIFGCFPNSLQHEKNTDNLETGDDLAFGNQITEVEGTGEEEDLDEWLTGVTIAQGFSVIPSPVQNLMTPPSLHGGGGNSKTSNGQFICSSDIIILIRSLESFYKQLPSLHSFTNEIQIIFQYLSQVQCNRDAACCFGHRLEEIIRIIANPRQGILRVSLVSYYGTLQSHLMTLTQKLIEIKQFIHLLTQPGWLSLTLYGPHNNRRSRLNLLLLTSSSSSSSLAGNNETLPYLRSKYESYDQDLMVIMNRIIRDFPQMNWNEFEVSYSYDMVLEIMETIDSYGGIKKIKVDRSKMRAISRLIQCNELELEVELKLLAPSMKRKLCRNLFCCCDGSGVISSSSSSGQSQHKRESYDDLSIDKTVNSSKRSHSKRTVSADLSEGLISDTSSYGAKAGDVDFFQPSLREEQHQHQHQHQQHLQQNDH